MKILSAICLGLFFSIPYGILVILIKSCLNQDDFVYWLATVMLFVGVLSFIILSVIFPSRKDKSE